MSKSFDADCRIKAIGAFWELALARHANIFNSERLCSSASNPINNPSKNTPKNATRFALLIGAAVVLSGCNVSSTLPSRNLDPLLSEAKSTEPASDLQSKAAPSPSAAQTATAAPGKKTELSAAVESALVPSKKLSPAESAAEKVTSSTAPSAPKPTETAALAPSAPKQPTPRRTVPSDADDRSGTNTSQPRKSSTGSGGFFASLARSSAKRSKSTNENNQKSVRITTNRRTRSAERRSSKGLPGVSIKRLFGIDSEEVDELDEPVRVASVANMARRGTHGLLLQRPGIKVGCFPASLVRILKKVERKFGRTPIVTSGYRSPAHNRRVRGARNSTHIKCLAADVQVKGVSKWSLARYLRSLPEVGGVGTYCHTKSVHVDIGKKRAWNRRCGKRRRRA